VENRFVAQLEVQEESDRAAPIMVGVARAHGGERPTRIVFAVHGDAAEQAFRAAVAAE